MKKVLSIFCLIFVFASTSNLFASGTQPTEPVKKAKGLQKELKLSDSQTTKVADIFKESAEKYDKIKAKEHGNTQKMLPAIGTLRSETITKINALLTPEQKLKYDKLLKGPNKSNSYGSWGDGWSATPSAN